MEKKLFTAAAVWTGIGLVGGLYYREFTKMNDFDTIGQFTQLGTVHTHSLVLGSLALLLALVLERTFRLSASRYATWFFIVWNVGLALTVGMQVVKGTLQVLGNAAASSPAVAGISGLGHITMTAGFILLFLALGAVLKKPEEA